MTATNMPTSTQAYATRQLLKPVLDVVRENELVIRFAEHPSTLATGKAIQATQDGFGLIYRMERDQQFGRSVVGFFWDIARLIFSPLMVLALNGIVISLRYLCSKDFRDEIAVAYLWVLGRFEAESHEQKVAQLIAESADAFPADHELVEDFDVREVM